MNTTIISPHPFPGQHDGAAGPPVLGLVICWSAEPGRCGEVALLRPDRPQWVLGRGEGAPGTDAVRFVRQRPGRLDPAPPLLAPGISRRQLALTQGPPGSLSLQVRNTGRCPLFLNGRPADAGTIAPGDTLLLQHQLLLLCVARPLHLPPLRDFPAALSGAFAAADGAGVVGEGPAVWRLRDQLAFCARSDRHVLVLGESGTGKELLARALHALSPRGRRPLVSRSAATFPAELIDAELFGNARNYPNPGMAERPGLIGEAEGSTLFLDEIGEMPADRQAHLLRVLDAGGEYQRLGESRARRADVRLVAATNRRPAALKHDFLARFALHLTVPGLDERREDVPLLAVHLLRREAVRSPDLVLRFFPAPGPGAELGEPRLDPLLVDALVRRRYTHHVRELEGLLWRAMSASDGDYLRLPADLGAPAPAPAAPAAPLTREAVAACLARHAGNQSLAWRELGLQNRFALHRLVKKYGIQVPRGPRRSAPQGGE